MAGYKKPSWMTKGFSLRASLRAGSAPYNPGSFTPRYVEKPSGAYNPGGGFENREVGRPAGTYNPGRFETRAVQQPSGAYDAGAFQDGEHDPRDPWGNYVFSVELDGTEIGSFTEASGMKSSTTIMEIEEGGANNYVHKRPGQSRWDNLILRMGECSETALIEWRDSYIRDEFSLRTKTQLSIVLRDNDGMELRRFDVVSPWPVSWEGGSLNSGSSDISIHTIEIAHEGILVDGGPDVVPDPPEPDPVPDKFETEPIQFDYDEATLTEDGQKTVDELNAELKKHPEVKEIWVEGHTCNMGSHPYNQTLSTDRSATVAAELQAKNPNLIVHSSGFSYDHPVASNSSNAGRVSNRRTEVWTTPRAGARPGELQ